jgi:hypothetical protein
MACGVAVSQNKLAGPRRLAAYFRIEPIPTTSGGHRPRSFLSAIELNCLPYHVENSLEILMRGTRFIWRVHAD